MLKILITFTISLLIGLLIGIERERSHPEGNQFIGVRTFTLLALTGTLLSVLDNILLTLTTSTFLFGLILINYYFVNIRQKNQDNNGIVTEISAAIIFCLGYFVNMMPMISITISACMLLVLIERKRLHLIARKKFKPHEIETAIVVIIFALGILPLLPNRTIDPWSLFNPKDFGILLTTVAGIAFFAYVAVHLFGKQLGIALSGLLGGFVSSLALFMQFGEIVKEYPRSKTAIIVASILATLAMCISVLAIVTVISPSLFTHIAYPIISMTIFGSILSFILLKFQKQKSDNRTLLSKPPSLFSILRTTIIIGLMLVFIALAFRYISKDALAWLGFISGLVEIRAITLVTVLLYLSHKLSIHEVRFIIYVALLASFIAKFVLLWVLTPRRFALKASFYLMLLLLSGGIVYVLGY